MVILLTIAGTLLSLAGCFGLYLSINAWRLIQVNIQALNESSEYLAALAQQQAMALRMSGASEEDEEATFGINHE